MGAVGGRRRAGAPVAAAVFAVALLLATPLVLPAQSRTVGAAPAPGAGRPTDQSVPAGPALSGPPNPYRNGTAASVALGQPQLNTSMGGHTAATLRGPGSIAFDALGDLWVADTGNSRVLEFKPPFSTGMNATLVVGQTTFTGSLANTTRSGLWEPQAIAFDAAGDLWVADSENDRVLEFVPPFTTGMDASLVLGQTTYTGRAPGTTAVNLSAPTGLAFDPSGDLFVADTGNNRVLEFVPPFQTGMAATTVLGQAVFTTSEANLSQTNLSSPAGLVFDAASDTLWVADDLNARVLGFSPPFTDGMDAGLLLGEPNYTTTSETLPFGMWGPTGVTVDPRGDVWVTDGGTPNRVSEFLPGNLAKGVPSVEEGQAGFNGTATGSNRTRLDRPYAAAFDRGDDLWVSDRSNNRIVEFAPRRAPVLFTETGLASGTAWSVTFDNRTENSTSGVITFGAINGSYTYTVPTVAGYLESPSAGTVREAGKSQAFAIAFTGTVGGLPPTTFWELIVALLVLLLIIVGAAILLGRRPPRPPAVAPAAASPAPPAGSGLPAGASPPPGSTPPP